jgi:hypothetical protein
MDSLQLVLRTALKADVFSTAAEMDYGTVLSPLWRILQYAFEPSA